MGIKNKTKKKMKSKKGQTNISNVILFGIILLVLVVGGIAIAFAGSLLMTTSSIFFPSFKQVDLPGQAEETAIGIVEGTVNALPLILGAIYVILMVGTLAIAYAFRVTGEKYLIILFLGLCVVAILGSILVSNSYQSFYEGPGDFSETLRDQKLISFMILHSPMIITILSFLGGIILFTGSDEPGGYI